MKRSRIAELRLGFSSFIVTLVLLFTILFPIFTKQEPVLSGFPSNFFGARTVGASTLTSEDMPVCGYFQMNATTSVPNNITVLVRVTTTDKAIACAIYDTGFNLVATTEARTIAAWLTPASGKRNTFNINWTKNASCLIANHYYYIAVWAISGAGVATVYYATSGGGGVFTTAGTHTNQWQWENPATFGATTDADGILSIYCNWTVYTAEWRTLQTTTGSISNITIWNTKQTLSGILQNTSVLNWKTIQTINGEIKNATGWKSIQTIDGVIQNTTGFKTIQMLSGAILNGTNWRTQQIISGTILNTTNWRTMQNISGLIFNSSLPVNSFGYENISGLHAFLLQKITSTEYAQGSYASPSFSGKATADNITFITADAWNEEIYVHGALYEYVDNATDYAGNLIAETSNVSVSIGSTYTRISLPFNEPKPQLTSGMTYYIMVAPSADYIADHSCKISTGVSGVGHIFTLCNSDPFPNPIVGESYGADTIAVWCCYSIRTPEWGTVQTLYGSILNTTGWRTVQTLSGAILNSTKWVTKQTIGGILLNITAWKTKQTLVGAIQNVSVFRTIQTISGAITNTTGFRTLQTLSGAMQNLTGFRTVQTLSGAIQNLTGFKTIQTLSGAITNTTGFRTTQTLSGVIQNLTGFKTVQTISGAIQNLTGFKTVQTLNGAILNVSGFRTIQTISGAILNTTAFKTTQTLTGTILNTTGFKTVQTINGAIQNSTGFRTIQTITGTILNISGFKTIQTISGMITNTTGWKTIQTIQGVLLNTTGFRTTQTIQGVIQNTTGFRTIQTINGIIMNVSGFKTVQTITGVILNETNWRTQQTLSGTILNTTNWKTMQTLNGIILNATAWKTVQMVSGAIQNISLTHWYTIQTINGEILNTTRWITTQTTQGIILNTTGFKTTQTTSGAILNATSWKTTQTVNGVILNLSGFKTIQTISGAILNSTAFKTIQTITGTILNTTGFKTVQTINGAIMNTTAWRTTQTITGIILNVSVENITITNPFPVNESIGVALQPTCSILINHTEGETMTLKWYENSTGAWILRQTNSSIVNGTYRYIFTQASAYNTKYWWNVTVNDTVHNISRWYLFTTLVFVPPINNPPNTPSNPDPANNSTGVDINKNMSWTGGDPDGDAVTYDVYFNNSITLAKVSSNQSGLTYDPGTMTYNETYYWRIVAWDEHGEKTTGPLWNFTTRKAWTTIITINGIIINTSLINITILSYSPLDNATGVCSCCDPMCIEINATDDVNMTVYRKAHDELVYYHVANYINISPAEYCFPIDGHVSGALFIPVFYNETYDWYVYIEYYNDTTLNYTSPVYNFTTEANPALCNRGGGGGGSSNRTYALIGLLGVVGLLGLVAWKKRKRNK